MFNYEKYAILKSLILKTKLYHINYLTHHNYSYFINTKILQLTYTFKIKNAFQFLYNVGMQNNAAEF